MLNQSYLGKHNFLLVTLDSCRYDNFCAANIKNIRKYGEPQQVFSYGPFTLPSHVAMFAGFLPTNPNHEHPYYNRRTFSMFRLGGAAALGQESGCGIAFERGATLAEAFKIAGYQTLGSGSVGWFDPNHPTTDFLRRGFEYFYYDKDLTGVWCLDSIDNQINDLANKMKDARPKFVFINSGYTHHPYQIGINAGVPQNEKRVQIPCIERFDKSFPSLLDAIPKPLFVILTADHGECFGEDGLWAHRIYHPVLHHVPMLVFEVT